MSEWTKAVRDRLSGLGLDGALESEIAEELAQHLEARYEALLAGGATEPEARRKALDELNDSALIHELHPEDLIKTRRPPAPEPIGTPYPKGVPMSGLFQDLKIAARGLWQRPSFTLMVAGMLALGIAGNAAIFSIFNGLFLRPFPFPEPGRLIDIDETAPKWNLHYVGVSNPDWDAWKKGNKSFDGMAFSDSKSFSLSADGTAQRILGSSVTSDLLNVLKLKPVLGRNFLPEEDRPKAGRVALLGYDLWKRQFRGDATVLGRILKLNGQPYTVVGVLPREAVYPAEHDIWVPLQADPSVNNGWYLSGIGRMKAGVTAQQAQADLLHIHKSITTNGKGVNEITSPILTPLRDRYLGDFRTVSRILLGGVGVVLLIACVNGAALMMVRGASRAREIAIRTAIGASRGRILRQLLSESALLAVAGGVTGVVLGALALQAMISMIPSDTVPSWVTFSLDFRFAGFCILVTGAAVALFGLLPAIQSSRVDLRGGLQDAAVRSTHSRARRLTLRSLVVLEVALALTLSIGAGLLVRAFQKVLQVDPGFRPDNVISFGISLPDAKYPKAEQRVAFVHDLLEKLRKLPGVTAAGAADHIPLGGHSGWFLSAEGDRPLGPNEKQPVVLRLVATPGYFSAIGMTFLAGRPFEERDALSKEQVAIVNESFAKAHWPNQSPIGKRITYTFSDPPLWLQVIGETKDEKHYGLDQEMRTSVFVTHGTGGNGTARGEMTVVLRGSIDPLALAAPARVVLRDMDPDLPMYDVRTMRTRLNQSLWARRVYSFLFGAFAIVAVALAAAGIYGVLAYAVSHRTREIGIRIALGARPGQVLGQTMASGMLLVSIGVAAGLVGAFIAVRLMESLLFGVSPRDPAVYTTVILGVVCIGLLANFVPARRAASTDPMQALRFE